MNFDKRLHSMSCHYWGLNDTQRCMLSLNDLFPTFLPKVVTVPNEHSTLLKQHSNAFQLAGQPLKLPFPLGDLSLHVIHGSLGPSESPQIASWSVQHFLWGAQTWPTDGQTDGQRCSICSNRPYFVHWLLAMWPNNNKLYICIAQKVVYEDSMCNTVENNNIYLIPMCRLQCANWKCRTTHIMMVDNEKIGVDNADKVCNASACMCAALEKSSVAFYLHRL